MSTLTVVTEADFDDLVLASPIPVLLDFFTVWCGPCKALAPTLADLAEEYGGHARVLSVDAEQSPVLAQRYGVTGYPTLVLLRDGAELGRPSGRSRVQLRAVLDEALGRAGSDAGLGSLPPEHTALAPEIQGLLVRLDALDEACWTQVEAQVQELGKETSQATAARDVDEAALIEAQTRLMNDVEELAATRVGPGERAAAIASAAAASFDAWVRGAQSAPGWRSAFATVPALRMSPYLPAGEPTTDPTTAAASYLQALAGLSDQRWITIRAENRDLWPFTERMTGGRVNAWLAAVILLQATVSAALVPTEVLASCWEPFAGVLEPLG